MSKIELFSFLLNSSFYCSNSNSIYFLTEDYPNYFLKEDYYFLGLRRNSNNLWTWQDGTSLNV